MFKFNDHKPIFIQIYEDLLMKLFNGEMNVGDKLPSVRELALHYTVNPNTIQKVFSELDQQQLIETERGKGTFITQNEQIIKHIKKQFINDEIKYFIKRINQMGMDSEEIIEKIKIMMGGENQHD